MLSKKKLGVSTLGEGERALGRRDKRDEVTSRDSLGLAY